MKKILLLGLIILVLVGCGSSKDETTFKIGILQWAEHAALDDAAQGLISELESMGLDKVEIIHKNANDDNSAANLIVGQFVDAGVDLIYAIATPAAQVAVSATEGTDIPVVFNAVTDAVSAGLVESNEKPNGRVTGVSDMAPIDTQLALIKEFLPKANAVGVIYNTGEDNSVHQIALIESLIGNHGMTLNVQGVSSAQEIALASEQVTANSDAIYIITDNMIAKAAPQVVGIANEIKVPVFMAESGQIDQGILASDSISYFGLGTQAARMVKSILVYGINPGDIPVEISQTTSLFVNEKVALELGVEIPDSILERATLK